MPSSSDTITGTPLSVGGGVRMATDEGDITLTAANIVAEQDVGIHAAGDLRIRSGQGTLGNANTSQSKAIGTVQVSDIEKFSGWRRQQQEDDSAHLSHLSQVTSNIGSLGGSINLSPVAATARSPATWWKRRTSASRSTASSCSLLMKPGMPLARWRHDNRT